MTKEVINPNEISVAIRNLCFSSKCLSDDCYLLDASVRGVRAMIDVRMQYDGAQAIEMIDDLCFLCNAS